MRRLVFEAHLWGDENPSPSNPRSEQDIWYSFNTAIELERELLEALVHNCGGPAAIKTLGGEWAQPTDLERLGRLLVLTFSLETPVTDEPWVELPFATSTTAGVHVAIDVGMSFPDGSSTDQGIITVP